MKIDVLLKKFRVKNGRLVSALGGHPVGHLRGSALITRIDGREYPVSQIIELIQQYYRDRPEITLSLSGKYQTIHGLPVRLYADDGTLAAPYHGAILFDDGWNVCVWDSHGQASNPEYQLKELT